MLNTEAIARRIALLRKRRGLSQAAMAQALSVTPQAVSKWERGQAVPDLETLLELSRFFDVSLHAILDSEESRLTPLPGRKANCLSIHRTRVCCLRSRLSFPQPNWKHWRDSWKTNHGRSCSHSTHQRWGGPRKRKRIWTN